FCPRLPRPMDLAWARRQSRRWIELPTFQRREGTPESIPIHTMAGAKGASSVASSLHCSWFHVVNHSYGMLRRGERRCEMRHEMSWQVSNSHIYNCSPH